MASSPFLLLHSNWGRLESFSDKLDAYLDTSEETADAIKLREEASKDQAFWETATSKASENGIQLSNRFQAAAFLNDMNRFGHFDPSLSYRKFKIQIVTTVEGVTGLAKVCAELVFQYAVPNSEDALKEYAKYRANLRGVHFDRLLEPITRREDFWHCVRILHESGVVFNRDNKIGLQLRWQEGPQSEDEDIQEFDFAKLDSTTKNGVVGCFDLKEHRIRRIRGEDNMANAIQLYNPWNNYPNVALRLTSEYQGPEDLYDCSERDEKEVKAAAADFPLVKRLYDMSKSAASNSVWGDIAATAIENGFAFPTGEHSYIRISKPEEDMPYTLANPKRVLSRFVETMKTLRDPRLSNLEILAVGLRVAKTQQVGMNIFQMYDAYCDYFRSTTFKGVLTLCPGITKVTSLDPKHQPFPTLWEIFRFVGGQHVCFNDDLTLVETYWLELYMAREQAKELMNQMNSAIIATVMSISV